MDHSRRVVLSLKLAQIHYANTRLAKWGMPVDYYLKELSILENQVRSAREFLERDKFQLSIREVDHE